MMIEQATEVRAQIHLDRRMGKVVAAKHSHYAIAGVLVVPGDDESVYAVATDGTCAALARCKGHSDAKHILPAELLPTRARAAGYDFALNGDWTCEKLSAPEVDGHFPRLRDVIPEAVPGCRAVSINARLLCNLADSITDTGAVTLIFPDNPNRPILVVPARTQGDDLPDSLGVIMPTEEDGDPLKRANDFRDAYTVAETAAE